MKTEAQRLANNAASRRWYRRNRAKAIKASRRWQKAHRKEFLAYHRKYSLAYHKKNRPLILIKKRTRHKKMGRDYIYGRGASEFYRAQKKKQKCLCNICLKKKRLVLDHCHKTGEFRPLICDRCNVGIGKLFDDPRLLRGAIKHLRKR
jgi:hypothetical protein